MCVCERTTCPRLWRVLTVIVLYGNMHQLFLQLGHQRSQASTTEMVCFPQGNMILQAFFHISLYLSLGCFQCCHYRKYRRKSKIFCITLAPQQLLWQPIMKHISVSPQEFKATCMKLKSQDSQKLQSKCYVYSALKAVLILYWEDPTEHRLCIEDLPYQLCSAYISFQLCFIIKIEMSNKFWRF